MNDTLVELMGTIVEQELYSTSKAGVGKVSICSCYTIGENRVTYFARWSAGDQSGIGPKDTLNNAIWTYDSMKKRIGIE